jgi:hypothetical protein
MHVCVVNQFFYRKQPLLFFGHHQLFTSQSYPVDEGSSASYDAKWIR